MLKQAYLLSLVSVAALGVVSLPAHADEQNSVQISNQTSAVVGDFNHVMQQSTQVSAQQQQGRFSKFSKAKFKLGDQNGAQEVGQTSGVVGIGNYVRQATDQITVQQQNKSFMNRFQPYRY